MDRFSARAFWRASAAWPAANWFFKTRMSVIVRAIRNSPEYVHIQPGSNVCIRGHSGSQRTERIRAARPGITAGKRGGSLVRRRGQRLLKGAEQRIGKNTKVGLQVFEMLVLPKALVDFRWPGGNFRHDIAYITEPDKAGSEEQYDEYDG